MGHNTVNVMEDVRKLADQGASFNSLTERIDTSGPTGVRRCSPSGPRTLNWNATPLLSARAGLDAAKAKAGSEGRLSLVESKKFGNDQKARGIGRP